jgi:hypothetical protein
VTASGTNVTYQWQFEADGSGNYGNLVNNSQFSGVTTPTLLVTNINGYTEGFYRCAVLDQCSTILSATVSLQLPPAAYNVYVTNFENNSFYVTLNGADPRGAPLSYILLTAPREGVIAYTNGNVYEYVATNLYYRGTDSFTYEVSNGVTNSAPSTAYITLLETEYPPTANNLEPVLNYFTK